MVTMNLLTLHYKLIIKNNNYKNEIIFLNIVKRVKINHKTQEYRF
jgi:hypothetical protein